MRIKLIPVFLFACLLFFQAEIQGQKNLTSTEAQFYAEAATTFLTVYDKNIIKESECVIMFLETDTTGRVMKINLMANSKEKHSLYEVLRKMKPDDFNKQMVNRGAMGKVVIVPVFSLRYSPDNLNYMDKMRMPFSPFTTNDTSAIVRETNGYIMVNGLSYVVGKPNRH